MRSVAVAGIVLPPPRVLSRVTGTACGVVGVFVTGALEAGMLETGAVFEREGGSGEAVEFREPGCDTGSDRGWAPGCVGADAGAADAGELIADLTGADVPCTAFAGCNRYQAPPAASKTAAAIAPYKTPLPDPLAGRVCVANSSSSNGSRLP